MSYADYWDVAKFTEDMAESVALRTLGTTKVEQYDGRVVDLATPWRRITLREAIADAVGIDYLEASREQLIEAAGEATEGDPTDLGEAGGRDLRQARRTDAARSPRTSSTFPSTCFRSASATPRIRDSPSTSTP